jgi:hypothetical protein
MMSKNLAVGLMVACLAIANPIESTLYKTQNAIAIASDVRIPNFTPEIGLRGNTADLMFPKDLIQAILRQSLAINEQRLKDTEFNRITIKGTNCEIVGDKIRISAIIQGEHRELIARNPITRKKHYTPWISASGRVTQLFGFQVVDNKTVVRNIGDPKLEGLEARWYAEAVSLAGRFIGPRITPRITNALSNFNGLDIRQYAIDKGSPLLASKLGVPEPQVRSVLNSNIGPINAGINGNSQFVISFTFPQF